MLRHRSSLTSCTYASLLTLAIKIPGTVRQLKDKNKANVWMLESLSQVSHREISFSWEFCKIIKIGFISFSHKLFIYILAFEFETRYFEVIRGIIITIKTFQNISQHTRRAYRHGYLNGFYSSLIFWCISYRFYCFDAAPSDPVIIVTTLAFVFHIISRYPLRFF